MCCVLVYVKQLHHARPAARHEVVHHRRALPALPALHGHLLPRAFRTPLRAAVPLYRPTLPHLEEHIRVLVGGRRPPADPLQLHGVREVRHVAAGHVASNVGGVAGGAADVGNALGGKGS